jgi:hypothetical protein
LSVEVEDLRARVSCYTRWEHCSKLLQALATRDMAAKLLGFKIRIR